MDSYLPKRKGRFHLLGLVHLPVSEKYMGCAYTQKIVKMAKMLMSGGHEVYLYGSEGSDAPCTKHIVTHTLRDIRQEWGDGDNRFEIGYDWHSGGFRHDFNTDKTGTWVKWMQNSIAGIEGNKQPDDYLLLFQGVYQKAVADSVQLYLTCEPGIGYRGVIRTPQQYTAGPFHAFESSYLMNFIYGGWFPGQSINGNYYDRVIPNYFDGSDFQFQEEKEDYFFYIGRMITRKGVWTAVNASQAAGAKLVIAGQKDGEINISSLPDHCEFIGYVGAEERTRLMGKARAVFVPSIYMEPFGGVNVEAQLCGTPVITTNFGAFTDTVEHGVTGYRCDTMQDFVNAARCVDQLTPQVIRSHAERYLMKNVRFEFQKWWDDLYQLWLSASDPEWEGKGWSYYE